MNPYALDHGVRLLALLITLSILAGVVNQCPQPLP